MATPASVNGVQQAEEERVRRFIAAYNDIDKLLHAALKANDGRDFTDLAGDYART